MAKPVTKKALMKEKFSSWLDCTFPTRGASQKMTWIYMTLPQVPYPFGNSLHWQYCNPYLLNYHYFPIGNAHFDLLLIPVIRLQASASMIFYVSNIHFWHKNTCKKFVKQEIWFFCINETWKKNMKIRGYATITNLLLSTS